MKNRQNDAKDGMKRKRSQRTPQTHDRVTLCKDDTYVNIIDIALVPHTAL